MFINRTNSSKNKQRKDVELFDFIRKGKNKEISTQKILNKLSISNSNNYYQLKNRIYNDLNNSMVTLVAPVPWVVTLNTPSMSLA